MDEIMFRRIASACCFLVIWTTATTWAGDPAPKVPEEQAVRFEQLLDMRSNVRFARQPQQALNLLDAMTDPEFLAAAMMMSAHPETWLDAMERAGSPEASNSFAQAATPDMLADWLFSSIDPQFQQAVLSRLLDPKKPQRWMQAMSDPRFYMPALATMNPAMPMQWMKVSADGRMIKPVQNCFDPKTTLDWMRLPTPVATEEGDKTAPSASYLWKPPLRY
jgi:hypothetical protein